MGMFLSKYGMLNALGSGEHGAILDETRKLLSRYKLFALVIHDPDHHSTFHSKFAEAFDNLDRITGPDFLFFGLTDPPKNWKERNERDYFGIWESDALLSPGNAYKTDDKSISAYTIAQALEIEYEDLPVIVLIDSFEQGSFWVLKTCHRHFELQLSEIGFFCSQYYGKSEIASGNPDFEKMISSIDLCGGFFETGIDEPIAKRLSDFLSFVVKENRNHHDHNAEIQRSNLFEDYLMVRPEGLVKNIDASIQYDLENLENHSKYVYDEETPQEKKIKSKYNFAIGQSSHDRLKGEVEEIILSLRTEFNKKIEKSKLFLFGCIANLIDFSKKESNLLMDERCENESKIILHTFNKVRLYYNEKDLGFLAKLKIRDSYELDYSPLILSLSKIFEIETNLSVVHWIRNQLNIEMPVYYNRHKDDNNTYCITPTFNQIVFT